MRIQCPHCAREFQVRDDAAGKKARCAACQQPFQIPAVNAIEAEPPVRKSKRSKSKKTRKSGKSALARQPLLIVGGTVAAIVIIGLIVRGWNAMQPTDGLTALPAAEATASAKELPAVARLDYATDVQPFFKTYCYECHGPETQEGGVEFHQYPNGDAITADRKLWTKVFDLVKVGAMPPSSSSQPAESERQQVVDWLDHTLFYVDCDLPHDPGRVVVHRLNRTEYDNTIRDLLAVDFKPSEDFPSDDVGYGFDNIGDVLSVPPLLVEKYLDAAEQVSRHTILTRDINYFKEHYDAGQLKTEGAARKDGRGLALVSRGSGIAEPKFRSPGQYMLRVRGDATQAGDEKPKLEFKLGDKVLHTFEFEGQREKKTYEFEFRADTASGSVRLSFLNDFYDEKARDSNRRDRNIFLEWVEVEGPLGIPENIPESQRVLTRVKPASGMSARDAAQANLKDFLPRAFRRPVTDAEVASYARFADLAAEQGEPFEVGMQVALQAVLVSPSFLFRVEDRRPVPGKVEVPVDDFALASRLSYFLWSSMPDDVLFDLARQNKLHEPAVLEAQVKRMLADDRADALIANFAGQWLGLRKLATNEVAPDPDAFPDFNDMIRYDMWQETELFFREMLRENRSIYDMLDARYTFVNDRLAKYYGIEGVSGPEFRKVVLTDGHRAGLLTHGSILTLTSYPTRTSPVKRGQWVLENLLGTPPPPAPPVVPALEETQKANPGLSFRKQLELHRSDPGCASCHKLMDDIGFGLENFDAVGRWREKDGEFPIDAAGVLPTGEAFQGPIELIEILRGRKDQFGRCLTEKMLTYATGRGTEYYDKCAIDDILSRLHQDDRIESLILGIVNSPPFLMRRANPEQ